MCVFLNFLYCSTSYTRKSSIVRLILFSNSSISLWQTMTKAAEDQKFHTCSKNISLKARSKAITVNFTRIQTKKQKITKPTAKKPIKKLPNQQKIFTVFPKIQIFFSNWDKKKTIQKSSETTLLTRFFRFFFCLNLNLTSTEKLYPTLKM